MKNNEITEKSNPFEIFNYKNLGSVKTTIDENGNPWFCLNDVCEVLQLSTITKVTDRLNPKGLSSIQVLTNGGPQNMIFVDEGNLYMAIGRSRKPEAQPFMEWVYREVLPMIRRTGSYHMPNNKAMTEIEMIHTISGEVIKHGKEMVRINKDIENINMQILMHESTLHIHEEKIDIVTEEGFFSISTFAKIVGLPVSLETARELGIEATKLCEDRGIMVSSIPHQIFGRVHIYPYKILREIFDDYIVKCANC